MEVVFVEFEVLGYEVGVEDGEGDVFCCEGDGKVVEECVGERVVVFEGCEYGLEGVGGEVVVEEEVGCYCEGGLEDGVEEVWEECVGEWVEVRGGFEWWLNG